MVQWFERSPVLRLSMNRLKNRISIQSFFLFRQLFERHGLHSVIAGPYALEWSGGVLWHGDVAIDRLHLLTDVYLQASSALRVAYLGAGSC